MLNGLKSKLIIILFVLTGILRTIDKKVTFLRPFQAFILFTVGALYGTMVRMTKEGLTEKDKLYPLMFHSIDSISPRYIEAIIIPLILFEVVHEIDVRTFTNLFLPILTLVLVSFGKFYYMFMKKFGDMISVDLTVSAQSPFLILLLTESSFITHWPIISSSSSSLSSSFSSSSLSSS